MPGSHEGEGTRQCASGRCHPRTWRPDFTLCFRQSHGRSRLVACPLQMGSSSTCPPTLHSRTLPAAIRIRDQTHLGVQPRMSPARRRRRQAPTASGKPSLVRRPEHVRPDRRPKSMSWIRSVQAEPVLGHRMQRSSITVVSTEQVFVAPIAHRRHLYCESLYKLCSVVIRQPADVTFHDHERTGFRNAHARDAIGSQGPFRSRGMAAAAASATWRAGHS